jgi:hypothetical protein
LVSYYFNSKLTLVNDNKIYVNKSLSLIYFTDDLINKVWLSDIVDKDFCNGLIKQLLRILKQWIIFQLSQNY